MDERRELWMAVAARNGFRPGSRQEAAYFRRYLKISPKTFNSNLSRGFAHRHAPQIRSLCADNKIPFDPDVWLTKLSRRGGDSVRNQIGWAGRPIANTEDFYDQLRRLYGSAARYRCLRVGGAFSTNRTRFDKFDDDGLAVRPASPSIRVPYLEVFWRRLQHGSLSGQSVHVIRTLDRLVELWAALELLRKHDLQDANLVYLTSVLPDVRRDLPTMGVRILDDTKTLFSLPALPHGHSHYSSWIESERLALFAAEYIERAKLSSGCDDLSRTNPVGLRAKIETAFTVLSPSVDRASGNYGILDTMRKLEAMKDRMVGWAEEGVWFPVIA